jgi:hypothetical protein
MDNPTSSVPELCAASSSSFSKSEKGDHSSMPQYHHRTPWEAMAPRRGALPVFRRIFKLMYGNRHSNCLSEPEAGQIAGRII